MQLQTADTEARLHAVEKVSSSGQGRPSQYIPVKFAYSNKLTKDDRLLLAFDALVLSQVLGRHVSAGKIIHGDGHATLKVKIPGLQAEVRKLTGKAATMLASGSGSRVAF